MPLWADVLVFVASGLAIGVAGTKLASYADRIADRTGLGEALTGTLLLGLMTALPGMTASIWAAVQGHAGLALNNAIGGIAFQTTVLAIADIAYRRANLEHAAASAANMMQTIMLILLITTVPLGLSSPNYELAHLHPATILLVAAAGLAFWLVFQVRENPMWKPHPTRETVRDEPESGSERYDLRRLILGLLTAGGVTLAAGAAVAHAAGEIVQQTSWSEAVVGGLLMAVATSLPELVTCVAAVRRGALTLAVSDIVGGNFFDVLFVAAADLAYLHGSIYHGEGVGHREVFVCCLAILLNVVLLAGLVYRQRHGPGNIGFESVLMLAIYIIGFGVLAFGFE